MVSVKQRRQVESWFARAARFEKGIETHCNVNGVRYSSAFECYAKAYEVDSTDKQVLQKLYELWPGRPSLDWRVLALRKEEYCSSLAVGDTCCVPMDEIIRKLIRLEASGGGLGSAFGGGRDEMLAISRIPFTPQLQVKTPREEAQCIVVSIAAR